MSAEQWFSLLAPIILAIVTGIITIYKDRPEAISHIQTAIGEAQQAEALAEKTKYETIDLLVNTLRSQLKTMSEELAVIKKELKDQCAEAELQHKKNEEHENAIRAFFESEIRKLKTEQHREVIAIREELIECYSKLKIFLNNKEENKEENEGGTDGGN